jgi:hypothetical protein
MNRETIRDCLHRTAMDEAQAQAFSRIFAEMATKSDLLVFEEKVDMRLSVLEEKLAGQIAHLKADLTWRMIAIVAFLGTGIILFNSFIG